MTEDQKRVVKLLNSAKPKNERKEWFYGYISNHYKRLSIGMDEATELAIDGFKECYAYFGTTPYFTQSIIAGAALSGKYKDIIIVTPSQYGKSWLCGQIALLLAERNEQVYVSGGTSDTSAIILEKTMLHVNNMHSTVKNRLLETKDKIERLATSTAKNKLMLKGGGKVEGVSLGETFRNNSKKGEKAIGKSGNWIIDEASKVSSESYAELGRSEYASDDGSKYIRLQISNPHNAGRFMDALTQSNPKDHTLIIWMDILTAFEEGRWNNKEDIIDSEFFQNKSTCKRYLLCELEDYSIESPFGEVKICDDEPPEGSIYFLGGDSAYKGKDSIEMALGCLTPNGTIRAIQTITVDKGNWIQGETSKAVIADFERVIRALKIKRCCIDLGLGVWLVEGLTNRRLNCEITGIDFGAGATNERKEQGHFAAKWGDNKRAEMHMDLVELIDDGMIEFAEEVEKDVREEMNAVRFVRKANLKTAVIAKDEMKKVLGHSPDKLDALLLMVHAVILNAALSGVSVYS